MLLRTVYNHVETSNDQTLDISLYCCLQAVNKSKKAKEFDLLIQENENLQRRLQSQEEDFRLQNGTLMQELSNVSEN